MANENQNRFHIKHTDTVVEFYLKKDKIFIKLLFFKRLIISTWKQMTIIVTITNQLL